MRHRVTVGQFVQNALVQLLKHAKGDHSQKQIARALTKLLLDGVKGKLSKATLVKKIFGLYADHCAISTGEPTDEGCCCLQINGLSQSCRNMNRNACETIHGAFTLGPCPETSTSAKRKAKKPRPKLPAS